jgi:hypothetical protein
MEDWRGNGLLLLLLLLLLIPRRNNAGNPLMPPVKSFLLSTAAVFLEITLSAFQIFSFFSTPYKARVASLA